jgi:hypothetical protein
MLNVNILNVVAPKNVELWLPTTIDDMPKLAGDAIKLCSA